MRSGPWGRNDGQELLASEGASAGQSRRLEGDHDGRGAALGDVNIVGKDAEYRLVFLDARAAGRAVVGFGSPSTSEWPDERSDARLPARSG